MYQVLLFKFRRHLCKGSITWSGLLSGEGVGGLLSPAVNSILHFLANNYFTCTNQAYLQGTYMYTGQ